MSLPQQLVLGHSYTKKSLSVLLNEPSLVPVREGLYSCQTFRSILIFVDLVKDGKDERFHFNDYFQEDYFHWDSQPRQNYYTPRIQDIVLGKIDVHLFVRIEQKIKSKTLPFKYCGRLEYAEHDPNTSKPIHLVFFSIDFDENNEDLKEIYSWKPENIGKSTTNNNFDTKSQKSPSNLKKPNYTERKGLVTSRVGQGYYRQEILNRWNNRCAVTGLAIHNILIASHIVPWRSANDDQRLDPENGILLSPNIDALFDKHLISFNDDGRILISEKIKGTQQKCLGVSGEMRLKVVSEGMKRYLRLHREIFNENN